MTKLTPVLPVGKLKCSRTFACAWPALAVQGNTNSSLDVDEIDAAWATAIRLGAADAGLLRPTGTCPICWGTDTSGTIEQLTAPCRPAARESILYAKSGAVADAAGTKLAKEWLDTGAADVSNPHLQSLLNASIESGVDVRDWYDGLIGDLVGR